MRRPLKTLAVATFTPAETEEITGVTQATQRDWRRREMTSFPTRKGRKRFTSYDLAHLIVLNQLLANGVRPGVAYLLARMSCDDPIRMLAKRTYPSATVQLDEEPLERRKIDQYAVYCRHVDGERVEYFATSDLKTISQRAKEASASPVAFYIIVDLSGVADRLHSKQIRPYFIEREAKN
jgi:DNA-binding transcriptional MerR regulator